MSINWGEIVQGEYNKERKVGRWKKMLNKGIQIIYEIKNPMALVSFPYLNND